MENFADIEGPVRIGLMGMILIGVAVLVLIVLAGFIARKFLRKGGGKPETPAEPLRSAFEIALDRLQALRSSQENLEAEPFTVEVSDIVRNYLEESLEVPVREQTSEEFLQTLQVRSDVPSALHETMPPFLEQCDRVKFARQGLAGGQKARLLDTASNVVETTDAHLKSSAEPPEVRSASS